MAEPSSDAPAGTATVSATIAAPAYRRLPLVEAGSPKPRRRRHVVGALLVAGYLVAAVVVIVAHRAVPVPQWLALHLLVLGAATNAVFIWSRHFAQSLLHVRPSSEKPAHMRLCLLNVGAVSVLAGVAVPCTPLAIAGATIVVAAAVAHTASLVAMARGATLGGRMRIAVRYYIAGGAALAIGAGLGAVLAAGTAQSDAWNQAVVLTHAHLNVLGWLGLTVIGTQFMLWPAVLRTRMTEDTPLVARRVLIGVGAGLVITVSALLLTPAVGALHWLAAAGMTLYAAAAVYSLKPVVDELRAKPPRSAAAWALLLGNVWLITALVVDVVGLARGTTHATVLLDRVLVPLLGLGAVAQILTGALSFLLPVTVGGGPAGNRRMAGVLDYAWEARAALANVGVLIIAVANGPVWRAAGWIGVLAGLGTFPLFVLAGMIAVRRPPQETRRTDVTIGTGPTGLTSPNRPNGPSGPDGPSGPADRPRKGRPSPGNVFVVFSIAVALIGLTLNASGVWRSHTATSGPAAGVSAQSGVALTVQLDEFSISPSVITVAPGTDLVLAVHNNGHMTHDLRLNGGQGTRKLAAGQQQTVDFGKIAKDVDAWCTVAGHREAGMVLHIKVASASAAGTATASPTMPMNMPMPGASGDSGAAASTPPPTWHAYDPTLKPVDGGTVHDVTLHIQETTLEVSPGVTRQVWTYNGTVPGPTLHGRVGDVFTVHVINDGDMEHSIDFHAGEVDPQAVMKPIPPGGELTYQFTAEHSGIWMYHCGTAPVIQHVAMGMYGAVVIDPPNLAPAAASLVMVQSEVYLGGADGVPAMSKLLAAEPDYVTFNGYANQYKYAPIHVPAGQRVRIWVLDVGPNAPSAFHVIGTQFDTVFKEGAYLVTPGNAAAGAAQVLDLEPGEGGFVEFTLPAPGMYTLIDHRLADAQRGAVGTLIADP